MIKNSIQLNIYLGNWEVGKVIPAYKKVKSQTKKIIDPKQCST